MCHVNYAREWSIPSTLLIYSIMYTWRVSDRESFRDLQSTTTTTTKTSLKVNLLFTDTFNGRVFRESSPFKETDV